MLDFQHPLWSKLDSAYDIGAVAPRLAKLCRSWDLEQARSLFWNDLFHQETLYGATYAAIPHLVSLSSRAQAQEPKREIAFFLAAVLESALPVAETGNPNYGSEYWQGLPATQDGWQVKRQPYQYMLQAWTNQNRHVSDYERSQIPKYERILSIPPITEADLEVVQAIANDFVEVIPGVAKLIEQALEKTSIDDVSILRSGLAAVEGLISYGENLQTHFPRS